MSMEKTIEEKRSAVLARCLEVCKDGAQPEFYWGSLWMRDGKPMYRLKIRSVMSMSGYVENEPDSTIHLLYSVMGLEARDAVEAEKARNTVLEEALEAIIYQDEVNGKGWENDSNSTYSRLCSALAAHKKGGQQG